MHSSLMDTVGLYRLILARNMLMLFGFKTL